MNRIKKKSHIGISALTTFITVFLSVISIPISAQAKQPEIPAYSGKAYVELNDNVPEFSSKMIEDSKNKTYETYLRLDKLGRCSVCVASIDQSLMPTEERGKIGSIQPSGWHTVKYNEQINGNYLYNRCHLIGYQLTGENANKKNLITGTRYMNVDGMLPFENKVANYLEKSKSNKVLYRVTPIFEGNNLLADGVKMEALSLNDGGKAICFNVFCYNVQPGIKIDYSNGVSSLSNNWESEIAKVTAESVKNANASSNSNFKTSTTTTQTETSSESTVQQPQPEMPSVASDIPCYLSATGDCYHSIDHCGRMNPAKATLTTVSQAEQMGKRRCSKCW